MNDIASVIIETIFNMFSMFAGVWFILSTLEPRFGFKKCMTAFTIILSMFSVAFSISKKIFDVEIVMNIKSITMLIVTIVIIFGFTRSKLSNKITIYLIFSTLGLLSDLVCVIIMHIATGKTAAELAQNSHELTVTAIIGTITHTVLI